MTTVTRADICKSVKDLGIKNGDIVLVHSSFKSMGYVDGGAEAVVLGFLDAIGEEGTLVFPTFCQKDFDKVYETWHLDKDSEVGYLTNYFRKREGSLRSDQATHSVAACGKYAYELTKTHGHTSKRINNMGDTAFAPDSPWEKMYQMGAKIVLLGVDAKKTTFRHYAESIYMEEIVNGLKNHPKFDEMMSQIWAYKKPGFWPHIESLEIEKRLEKENKVMHSICGDAEFKAFSAVDFTDVCLDGLRNADAEVLWDAPYWNTKGWIEWQKKAHKIIAENK